MPFHVYSSNTTIPQYYWPQWNTGTSLWSYSTTTNSIPNWVYPQTTFTKVYTYSSMYMYQSPPIVTQQGLGPTEHVLRRSRSTNAYSKAQLLLESMLSPGQLEEMTKTGRFHVTGSQGRRYCIRTAVGRAGNVDLLDQDGGFMGRFCAHPENVPDPDVFVAQMLVLESDEDRFLRVANLHSGRLPDAIERPLVTV